MSVTIITTVSGTISNSYCTSAEADAYFEADPFFSSTWSALTDAEKNQYLVASTRAIDRMHFIGCRYDDDQILEFPRDITDQITEEGDMPQRVKDAQCEMIKWLKNHLDSSDGSPEKKITALGLGKGDIQIQFDQYTSNNQAIAGGYPESVRSLLSTWLKSIYNIEVER